MARLEYDMVQDQDSLILLGLGKTVYHTILVRGPEVLFDSLGDDQGHRYDPVQKNYLSEGALTGRLNTLREISVHDFQRDYMGKILLPVMVSEVHATKDSPKHVI